MHANLIQYLLPPFELIELDTRLGKNYCACSVNFFSYNQSAAKWSYFHSVFRTFLLAKQCMRNFNKVGTFNEVLYISLSREYNAVIAWFKRFIKLQIDGCLNTFIFIKPNSALGKIQLQSIFKHLAVRSK